ncbi:hypothetical protein BDY19DRAFT_998288 [Irpex rosettiformis]|uniref:Uncharacterized protein n=1 Tax=Irpex rosettiformis TaxID=378272 RepID=A0ACB8TP73_9APHY|nr:hypothetical protein BDY19DRAFT_998288 [Irpex rosettiformis]
MPAVEPQQAEELPPAVPAPQIPPLPPDLDEDELWQAVGDIVLPSEDTVCLPKGCAKTTMHLQSYEILHQAREEAVADKEPKHRESGMVPRFYQEDYAKVFLLEVDTGLICTTGSGKTEAFVLPLLADLVLNKGKGNLWGLGYSQMADKRKRTTSTSKTASKKEPKPPIPAKADTNAAGALDTTKEKRSQRPHVEEVTNESEGKKSEKESTVSSEEEELEEDADAQLARLQVNWTAVVYVFYKTGVTIVHVGGRHTLQFHCDGLGCKSSVLHYLGMHDSTSTRNLRKHIQTCKSWGEEALAIAKRAGLRADKTHKCFKDIVRSRSIKKAFECTGKGKVSYSLCQHTRSKTWSSELRLLFRPCRFSSTKAVFSLFDISKDKDNTATLDNAEKVLMELAEGLELEEAANRVLDDIDSDDRLMEDDDNDIGDSMKKVMASMSPEELDKLRASALPVQTVLVKISFTIIDSLTILLLA